MWLEPVVAILIAYGAGSVPTGLLLARAVGTDLRNAGSGNIGATNVARTVGLRLGLLTLLVDASKGALPVLLAEVLALATEWQVLVGLSAIAGHLFPVFSRFRGGKGVATAAGVFLVLAPLAVLVALPVFGAVFRVTRIVSLASLVATCTLPLASLAFGQPAVVTAGAALTALAIVLAHRDNLRRLQSGTEPRFRPAR